MMRYIKPLRIPIYQIPSKKYMKEEQADELFRSRLVVEEKLDGNMIYRPVGRWILYLEDLYHRRTIPYRIPARYALFDIYDIEEKLILGRDDRIAVFEDLVKIDPALKYQIFHVPELERGVFNWREDPIKIADSPSRFADQKMQSRKMEGVVFKLEQTIKITEEIIKYLKIVNAKFVNDEFYRNMQPEKITGLNVIDPSCVSTERKNQSHMTKEIL
ncbi:MAG: RNA ligase family protein [Candidatus Anstonellales archaeon]